MTNEPSCEELAQQVAALEKMLADRDAELKRLKAGRFPGMPDDTPAAGTHDSADQAETGESFLKSENRYRLLFENAPLGYQSLDENGNFIEVNRAWLDTLGYTRDEVIGKNFGDFLHPDWADHFKENFPRFKAVGEILGVEFEIRKKDGGFVLVSFNGKIRRNKAGAFQQTHCIFHNITEKRQAEERLLRSEREKKAILSGIRDVTIHYLDTEMRIIWSNAPEQMRNSLEKNGEPVRETASQADTVMRFSIGEAVPVPAARR